MIRAPLPTRLPRYAARMSVLRAVLLALALPLFIGSCGHSATPRRDLVLVLLPTSGAADPDAALSDLRERAEVYRGPERHAGTELPAASPAERRVSILTGTRPDDPTQMRPTTRTLMWIAHRSGREALALCVEGALGASFDDFQTKANAHTLERAPDAAALLTAWQATTRDLAARAADRARVFAVLDFGAELPDLDALAASLAAFDGDVAIAFTGDDTADRLWLVTPDRGARVFHSALDPREVFGLLCEVGRIQLPSTGQGMRPPPVDEGE